MASSTLGLINQDIQLVLEIGGVLIPLIKGAITDIKKIFTPQGTVEYTVVIATDQAELAEVATVSIADLVAINAQLKALGKPTLDVPAAPAPIPPTTPAA